MSDLKLISATRTNSPVDVTGFKEHIGFSGTSKDTLFETYLETATDEAQSFTGRQFLPALFELHLPAFADVVEIEPVPVTGINSVKYYDTSDNLVTLTSGIDYYYSIEAEPATLHFANTYAVSEYRANPVIINFGAGYSTADKVPPLIKAAIKLAAAGLYVSPSDSVRNLPTASRSLLRHYRV